ncbi:MAG: hypothetical protein ACXVIG_01625 [Halobacteriota archaeon]
MGSKDPQKIDEYENALQVAEAIYDKRVAKIMKLAALAAKGHKEGAPLTDEEMRLFEVIFDAFTRYKEDMLAHAIPDNVQSVLTQDQEHNILVGDEAPSADVHRVEDERSAEEPQDVTGVSDSVIPEESSDAGKDIQRLDNARALIQENKIMRYVQVRVLADIPAFIGLDGENYKLSKGETALLPEGNARALTKRQVAITIGDKVEDA